MRMLVLLLLLAPISSLGETAKPGASKVCDGYERVPAHQSSHRKVWLVAVSSDGRRAAVGIEDEGLSDFVVFDIATASKLWSKPEGGSPKTFAFSPDGELLAVGYVARLHYECPHVELLRTDTGKIAQPLQLTRYDSSVEGLAFSPDGKLLGATLPTVRVWSVVTGKTLADIQPDFFGERQAVERMDELAFSPDSKTLLTASQQRQQLFLWDIGTGRSIRSFSGPDPDGVLNYPRFSADGRFVDAVGIPDESDLRWDRATGQRVPYPSTASAPDPKAQTPNAGGNITYQIDESHWNPDARDYDPFGPATIKLTNTKTGAVVATLTLPGRPRL